jgi:hypothetical protein
MPWHQLPMKDAHGGETCRGGATILLSGNIRMGKPTSIYLEVFAPQAFRFIGIIKVRKGTFRTETSK